MSIRFKSKIVFCALAAVAALWQAEPAGAEAMIPIRGVVEGFYGTPWHQKERVDIIRFCAEQRMNAYIYAPKDDPYHRDKWREPYPSGKLKELRALVKEAQAKNVRFIFAISPGLDMHFEGVAGYRDRSYMIAKLTALYDLGVRDFAVFFDDIDAKNAKGQAELLNWLTENFVATHEGVSPLFTVPTEYFLSNVKDDYVPELTRHLHPEVRLLYTGNECVPDGLSDADYQKACEIYGRPMGIWWNYPVSDYMEAKLALGAIEKLPTDSDIPAIFFNPMKHEHLSKISLATGADYACAPASYEPEKSWEQSLREQYGWLARDMRLFAEHSRDMDNRTWAKCGPADAPAMRACMDEFWKVWQEGKDVTASASALDKDLSKLERACQNLQDNLPGAERKECLAQLKQLKRIAQADRKGLELLCNMRAGKKLKHSQLGEFKDLCREVRAHDKEALISEKTARAFMEEVEKALQNEPGK